MFVRQKENWHLWSPLIWRTHTMRRVVGSTLSAETQSLLNGLGHAEWIAAHFAEARFPNFDVAQRSIFLRHFQIQCIVDAKSLYDHLISLSSPSSVEDKRCGFDLVITGPARRQGNASRNFSTMHAASWCYYQMGSHKSSVG